MQGWDLDNSFCMSGPDRGERELPARSIRSFHQLRSSQIEVAWCVGNGESSSVSGCGLSGVGGVFGCSGRGGMSGDSSSISSRMVSIIRLK